MLFTVIGLLALVTFILVIAHAADWKVPLCVPVLLLSLIELLRIIPLGSH